MKRISNIRLLTYEAHTTNTNIVPPNSYIDLETKINITFSIIKNGKLLTEQVIARKKNLVRVIKSNYHLTSFECIRARALH